MLEGSRIFFNPWISKEFLISPLPITRALAEQETNHLFKYLNNTFATLFWKIWSSKINTIEYSLLFKSNQLPGTIFWYVYFSKLTPHTLGWTSLGSDVMAHKASRDIGFLFQTRTIQIGFVNIYFTRSPFCSIIDPLAVDIKIFVVLF